MLAGVIFLAAASVVASPAVHPQWWQPEPRSDVNYAMGGATTGVGSFIDTFQPELAVAIRAHGLDTGGLARELMLAEKTLFDVDPAQDVFWLWAGGNDYITGERDPTLPPARIGAALERLYTQVGARIFVVPNLPALGLLPVMLERPDATPGMNHLTAYHNQVLAGVLAQFATVHPDAVVIPVDMFSVFAGFATDVRFSNVTQSCVDVALPAGLSCDGWLFVDKIHTSTVAAEAYASAAAASIDAALGGARVRRVIGFGDSLSDTGVYFDTLARVTGTGSPAAPVYYQGRFSNGPVVTDYLQELLDVEVPSTFFPQPLTTSVTATRPHWFAELHGTLALSASVRVPGRIAASSTTHGLVLLQLGEVYCLYWPVASSYQLLVCTQGASAASRVDVERVSVRASDWTLASLTVELLYY